MKKYAILTSKKAEADCIIRMYNLDFFADTWNIKFYENDDIVLCVSGVGKIQSSIATSCLISRFSPEFLINIGIAWNARPNKVQIWDVVLVTRCSQHDIYLPFWGEHNDYLKSPIHIEWLVAEGKKFDFWIIEEGKCITWDQFIDNLSKVRMLSQIHDADCIDMEAFAFLSTARELWELDKCIVIKWISDKADSSAKEDHENNLKLSMNNALKVLEEIIDVETKK